MTKAKELAELASVTTVASGNVTFSGQVNGRDVAADGVLAAAALPKGGGALTGAVTTNSTIDGRDVAADGVLATNALPKAGGTVTGDVTFNTKMGIGSSPSGAVKLHLADNHTTNVTNAATLLANTTFSINGNTSEGSDTLRMGPMSLAGAYFIDVSNGGASAEYPLLLNPISGGKVGFGTTTFVDGSKFQFEGAKTSSSGIPRGQVNIVDTTAVATGVGGSIGFVGNYSGTSKTTFGSIEGSKTNGTGGNYGGALVLRSRTNGGNLEESIRIDADGLKFHGDTAAGNALNDYEEGYWSPVFHADNGSNPAYNVGFVQGSYTKIGRLVTINYTFENFQVTGNSTTAVLLIAALPFSIGAVGSGFNQYNGPRPSTYGITFVRPQLSTRNFTGNRIGFFSSTNGGGWGWEYVNILGTGGTRYLTGSMTYHTDS